jgi:hypothetical protein
VGVYQGEAIEVRQNEWGHSHSYHWVVHKLEYRDLFRHIDNCDIVSQLHCLACLLDRCHTQSHLLMIGSQYSGVVKLDKCPLKRLQYESPATLAVEEHDNVSTQDKLGIEQDQNQEFRECQQCPRSDFIANEQSTQMQQNRFVKLFSAPFIPYSLIRHLSLEAVSPDACIRPSQGMSIFPEVSHSMNEHRISHASLAHTSLVTEGLFDSIGSW